MGKTARMQKLTPAEISEQQDKECRLRGEAIADKYISSRLRTADLDIELARFYGRKKEL